MHSLAFGGPLAPIVSGGAGGSGSQRHREKTVAQAKSAILHEKDLPTISRVGGASTTQMVTPNCGAQAFLNGFTDIPAGAAIPLHFHNCEESVLVVEGRATVEIDGEMFEAVAGDVTWLPANVPHRFINPSRTDKLRIFWTYATVDATRTLVESGETGPILAEHKPAGQGA